MNESFTVSTQDNRKFFMLGMAAPRGSGKSYFARLLLRELFNNSFDYFIIICPSLDVNCDYDEFRDDTRFVFYANITEHELEKIFEHLYGIKANMIQNRRAHQPEKKRAPRVLILFDDVIDTGMINFRGPVDKFAQRGRHINVSVMVLAQGIASISLPIRRNSDFFVIFRPYNFTETERFLDEFIPKHEKKYATRRMIEVFDTEYQFILVDNTATSVYGRLQVSDAHSFVKGITFPFFEQERNTKKT